MKYSDEALKKHPWLWKFDDRRLRGCKYNGHSFRWFKLFLSNLKSTTYLGLCKRCSFNKSISVAVDQSGELVKLQKEIVQFNPIDLTDEQTERVRNGDLSVLDEIVGTRKTNIEPDNPQDNVNAP